MIRHILRAAVLFTVGPSFAQTKARTEPVRFQKGSSSTTIKNSIKGYDSIQYVLELSAKQTLEVNFEAGNRSCYFNLSSADADQAMFNGSVSGERMFSAEAPVKGRYAVEVYMMRNAARRNETCRYILRISAR